MEYSSNAKGNLGVTLGTVGTGLGLLDASNKIDYPSHIENAGIDPDELMD